MAQLLRPTQHSEGRATSWLSQPTVEPPSSYLELVARADDVEAPLVVEFVGLSESEQLAAINGFPGGQRFRLASRQH